MCLYVECRASDRMRDRNGVDVSGKVAGYGVWVHLACRVAVYRYADIAALREPDGLGGKRDAFKVCNVSDRDSAGRLYVTALGHQFDHTCCSTLVDLGGASGAVRDGHVCGRVVSEGPFDVGVRDDVSFIVITRSRHCDWRGRIGKVEHYRCSVQGQGCDCRQFGFGCNDLVGQCFGNGVSVHAFCDCRSRHRCVLVVRCSLYTVCNDAVVRSRICDVSCRICIRPYKTLEVCIVRSISDVGLHGLAVSGDQIYRLGRRERDGLELVRSGWLGLSAGNDVGRTCYDGSVVTCKLCDKVTGSCVLGLEVDRVAFRPVYNGDVCKVCSVPCDGD